ncbi:hypothetical protein LUZ60_005825 [Juncus effusus]|nr:hypothetical protein LUZ60_005825 [Juncus effusus]
MAPLAPLSEEPINEDDLKSKKNLSKRTHSFRAWITNHLHLLSHDKSDLRMLLSVIGCPLSPVPLLPSSPRNVASTAQYILEQFRATTGCAKIEGGVKSMYASGRVTLTKWGPGNKTTSERRHAGCFVMWQLMPEMWLIELAVSGHKIMAGSNGHVAWRRTPWLGAHAARGGVRPLRRALQGLDPVTISAVFSPAEHIGEKFIGEEDCFVLKLEVDNSTLSNWSDSTAEVIKHNMFGFFSQRSGLLVRLDDCQLTRIQTPGAEAMYWETSISSSIEDYRTVDGVAISHSGRSVVSLVRFGFGLKSNRVLTQMEEVWSIDDVVFNVPGLSFDSFIPPEEVR